MNQILAVSNNRKSSGSVIEIKKIILFFCIAMMVFGVILVGEGIYGVINKKNTAILAEQQPSIHLTENGRIIQVSITHNVAISKVTYYWNSSEQIIKQINKSPNVNMEIEMIEGTNTLTIEVTDVFGKKSEYKQEFIYDDNTDRQKPNVELSAITNSNTVKIIARDETEIDYITYRWNDEQETQINVDVEDKNKIETVVEIPKGKNELTVFAVDKNNNTETKTQSFIGLTKANINVYREGEYLVIQASHEQNGYEEGISLLKYTLNGQWYEMNLKEINLTKEQLASRGIIVEFTQENKISKIEYKQKMVPGTNRLSVYVYTLQETESTFDGVAEL